MSLDKQQTEWPEQGSNDQQPAEPAITSRQGALTGVQSLYNKFFARWASDGEEETLDWLVDANSALVHQEPIRARALLYVVGIALILLIIWAAFAEIDEVTRGDGKVIPTRQVQIVQSLDGGVVTSIDVKEGDVVEAGQLLVRLDATRFTSSLRENEVEYLVLKVKAARLKAVSEGVPFAPEAQCGWKKFPMWWLSSRSYMTQGISQLALGKKHCRATVRAAIPGTGGG